MVPHDVGELGLRDDLERQVVGEVGALVGQDLDAHAETVTFGFGAAQSDQLAAGVSVTVMTASSTLTRGLTPIHATVATWGSTTWTSPARTRQACSPPEGRARSTHRSRDVRAGTWSGWSGTGPGPSLGGGGGAIGKQPDAMERPPKGPHVLDWYEAGIEPLTDTLRQPVPGGWNFVGVADPGGTFWPAARRSRPPSIAGTVRRP